MDITWGIETTITASNSQELVDICPFDVWVDVKISPSSFRIKGGPTVEITSGENVFKYIPESWYKIHN